MTATAVVDAASGRHGAALISALHAACFDPAWEEAAVAGLLALPGTAAMVVAGSAPCRGPAPAPAGFALFRVAADEAEILALGVRPGARRRGLGRTLLAACLERARIGGARTVYLEAAESNRAALALYRGAGFRPAGLRKNYYRGANKGDPGENALLLRLRLETGPAGGPQALRMRTR